MSASQHNHKTKRVLVTGSDLFFSVGLIREFALAGWEVTAADSLRFSVGKASKYTSRSIRLPPLYRSRPYIDAIVSELSQRKYDLLVPVFEEALLISKYKHIIERFVTVLLPCYETMVQLHDKYKLSLFCASHGIPCAPTYKLSSLLQNESYPALSCTQFVVKPSYSCNSVGRLYFPDYDSLVNNYRDTQFYPQKESMLIAQERISGSLVNTLYFCNSGTILAEYIYTSNRTLPSDGGTAVERITIKHPEVSEVSSLIIKSSNWEGFVGIDYIVESGTNQIYTLDVNPRLNAGFYPGLLSGIDWIHAIECSFTATIPEKNKLRSSTVVCCHSLLLELGWIYEGLTTSKSLFESFISFKARLTLSLRPQWEVTSRDELIDTSEWLALLALLLSSLRARMRSILTRKPIGQTIIEDSCISAPLD